MKRHFIKFLIILFSIPGFSLAIAQKTADKKIYTYNYKWEIPATVAGFALNAYGLDFLKDKSRLDSMTVMNLDRDDIWYIDREATYQDAGNFESAQLISDIGMNISLFLPALLALDNDIRRNWLDVLLIYLETQAVGANLYLWAGPVTNSRIRPFVYNPDFELEMKLDGGAQDSFFSGHTLWTASASFFMAKVYSDYHPELGTKKYWYFAAALIPPVFVGFSRYKASKHFPTDIFTGLVLGATTGILVPHLHKANRKNFALAPFFGNYNGIVLSMKF